MSRIQEWRKAGGMIRVWAVGALLAAVGGNAAAQGPGETSATATRVAVVFSGGHETDGRDGGRPVGLIGPALGVTPEIFREAFSRVRPAPAGTHPDREQVRRNKSVLLGALSRYGVTNERLDEVSNYYRYNRSRGEMWPTKPAAAYALVTYGRVTGFTVTNGGAGYSTPPTITVPGVGNVKCTVQLSFGKNLATNGSVTAITLEDAVQVPR